MKWKMKTLGAVKKLDKTIGSFTIFLLNKADKLIPRKSKREIKKILLIKFGNIGDVVITTPAIKAIHKRFPKAEIIMLTSNRTNGLYEQYPYINKVITRGVVENKGLIKNIFFTFVNIFILIWVIRKEEFDLAIDFESYSTFSAFLTFISGARTRLGVKTKENNRAKLFTHKIPYIQKDRHEAKTFLDLISLIGIKANDKRTEITISQRDKKFAENALKNLRGLKVAIHAGSNTDWIIKRWPKEDFIELINHLTKKYQAKIILVGSSNEKSYAKEIIDDSESKSKLFNLVGKTNLNQLAALLSKCNLFIGSDSAPMHISVAVDTPVVAIMNYVNPKRWGPYGKGHIALTKASPANPYWNGYIGDYDIDENLVSVDEVKKAVKKQIAKMKN